MHALRDGIRRVNEAPAILLGVWLLTLAVSLPLTLAARAAPAPGWMSGFVDAATGVGVRPPAPAVEPFVGALPPDQDAPGPLGIVAASYFTVWLFLAGGIIDRYARDRATRSSGFFAAAGVFFFRFLRLAVAMWLAYALLFWHLRPRLAGPIHLDLIFAALLAAVQVVFDYAQIASVVEDRRSMSGALAAAARFVAANAGAVASVYLADIALLLLSIAIYSRVAPGGTGAGVPMWSRFLVAQMFVLAGLWIGLVRWASEAALFQSRLAHAGYVAAATPAWPESPSAEALRRS